MKTCHKCLTEWQGIGQPVFKAACAQCSADLHVCLNCRFYNIHKPYDCECDIDETVRDKARANYCEEFEFRNKAKIATQKDNLQSGRDAFKKLFQK